MKQINVYKWACGELRSVLSRSGWRPLVTVGEYEHFVKGPAHIVVRYQFLHEGEVYADTPVHSMKYGAVVCDSRGAFHVTTRK